MEAATGALHRGQSLWGPASLLPPLGLWLGREGLSWSPGHQLRWEDGGPWGTAVAVVMLLITEDLRVPGSRQGQL